MILVEMKRRKKSERKKEKTRRKRKKKKNKREILDEHTTNYKSLGNPKRFRICFGR